MNATAHGNARKVVATAIVAVFMLCSSIVVLEGGDAATEDEFALSMRVGDSFSYLPTTNLSGTTYDVRTTFGGVSSDVFHLDATGLKVEGKPTVAGTYRTVITANWSADGLEQTAEQVIVFSVYDRIHFRDAEDYGDASQVIGIPGDTEDGTIIHSVGFRDSPADTVFDVTGWKVTYRTSTDTEPSDSMDLRVAYSDDRRTAQVEVSTLELKEGYYTVEIPAKYDSGPTDRATYTLTVVVAGDIAITNERVTAFIGESDGTKRVPIGVIGPEGMTDIGFTLVEADENGLISIDGDNIVIDTNGLSSSDINGEYGDFDFTLRVTANVTPEGAEEPIEISDEKTVRFRLYKDLRFTSAPQISDIRTYTSSESNLKVMLAMNIVGATRIVYDWGDGQCYDSDVSGRGSTFYSTDHKYASEGRYLIKVTAYNDYGNNSVFIRYDTTEEDSEVVDPEADMGFFERHGWTFLVFTCLSALFAIAYLFVGFRHPVMVVLAAVFAVFAVLLFIHGDLNSLIDAFMGGDGA